MRSLLQDAGAYRNDIGMLSPGLLALAEHQQRGDDRGPFVGHLEYPRRRISWTIRSASATASSGSSPITSAISRMRPCMSTSRRCLAPHSVEWRRSSHHAEAFHEPCSAARRIHTNVKHCRLGLRLLKLILHGFFACPFLDGAGGGSRPLSAPRRCGCYRCGAPPG